MGDVLNLNRFRKQKLREQRERRAEANAIQHGRTKAEQREHELLQRQQQAVLDGARRDGDASDDDDDPPATDEVPPR